MYLVTGGAGFIGSSIVKKLVDRGERVRVIDNLSTGSMDNLDGFTGSVDFVGGDITDPQSRVFFNGVDVVLHQAAVSSVQRSVEDPAETEYNNVMGTVNVLKFSQETNVKRVVMAGSAAVYGDSGDHPLKESVPVNPLSPYAFSKYAGEYYCKSFFSMYGLETVVLRYFNVFGPGQDPHSDYTGVISRFIEMMLGGNRPVIFGDGEQTRDFVYVDDVAGANLLAADSTRAGSGDVINIAGGRSISIIDLVEHLNAVLGTDLKPVFEEARKGDIRHSRADITLAGEMLGFAPGMDFREGLQRTVNRIKQGR